MKNDRARAAGIAALAAFALCVWAANAAIDAWGFWSLAGLSFPAGVIFAGLSFQLRDVGQEGAGTWAVAAAIVVGTALSFAVNPGLAVASGAAFALSETADLAVYTPLRERGWLRAVALSGIAGSAIDSLLFLWLAEATIPGPTLTGRAWLGLFVGKLIVVAVCTAALAPARHELRARGLAPAAL